MKFIASVYCLKVRKPHFVPENKEGMHRSDIVEWYLNLIADQIETEDELLAKKELIEKVIDRLIFTVSYQFLACYFH